MESTLRRTWAEIDLDALAHNYSALKKRIGENVKFLGVVKADAYGHGSVQISRLLQDLGADYLAVSSIDEAIELRKNNIKHNYANINSWTHSKRTGIAPY